MYFIEVDKTCVYVFGMFPRFLENLLESGILFCCPADTTKTALGIIQLWFNYFAASFYKAIGARVSNVRKRKVPQ